VRVLLRSQAAIAILSTKLPNSPDLTLTQASSERGLHGIVQFPSQPSPRPSSNSPDPQSVPSCSRDCCADAEDLFASLLVNLPGAFYRRAAGSGWPVQYISEGIEAISGYPRSAFTGDRPRTLCSLIHPEDRGRVRGAIEGAIAAQTSFDVKYRLIRVDGATRWVRERGRPIFDSQQTPCYLDGAILDIGETQAAREVQRESEETCRLLVEHIKDYALVRLDRRGRVVSWNLGAQNILGYQPEEIFGRHFSCFYPPAEVTRDRANQKLDRCATDGRLEERGWQVRKDGSRFWAEVSFSPLFDAAGQLCGFCQVTCDRTERKTSEDALHKAHADMVNLLDNLNEAFFSLDWQLRFTYINNPAELLLERSRQTLLGQPISVVFLDRVESFATQLQACLVEHVPVTFETRDRFADRWWEVRAYPSASGISVFLSDIGERKAAIDALKHSEELYRTLARNFPNGSVALFDRDLHYTLAEGTELEHFGRSGDRFVGSSLDRVWPASVAEILHPLYRKALDGEPTEIEIADGDRVYAMQILPVKNESGEIFAGMAVTQNITDRKQAEEENRRLIESLQKSEAQMRSMASLLAEAEKLAHVGCWEFDLETATMAWSDEIYRIFDLTPSPETPTYEDYLQQIHPDDREMTQQLLDRAIAECEPYEFDQRLLTADGSVKYLAAKGEPILDENGRVVKLIGSILDITERQKAQEALQQSEAELEKRARELEQTLNELRRTQTQLIQTERMSGLGQMVAGIAHEINNPVSFVYGNIVHANSYIEDIFYLLELYRQHYPQPVPEIEEEIQAVDLEFVREDLPKLVRSMRVGAERIREIVRGLRNFSRLDEADMKAVDIHEGIDSTLLILQSRLKGIGRTTEESETPFVEVVRDYGDLPPVDCYASELNQVFLNLLNNAIDALERQQPPRQLRIRTSRVDPETDDLPDGSTSDWVEIRIADNGVGIPPELRSRIFDPFFTTKPVGSGTGLGLSIGYQIVVEKHGGQLICTSEVGEGSEFIVRLPVRQDYDEPALFED
jgi:PAS domain S-box-containing protein